jgi:hypothetical protein
LTSAAAALSRRATAEYEEMRELVREGLEVVRDAPPERRAAMVAAGTLPEQPGRGGRA